MNRTTRIVAALVAATACIAAAQPFPSRPVHIVVPFAPGGNLDVTARLIGESMSKTLGQSFVIENKPGAGGVLGQELVARAAPDGYTLVAATTGTTIVSPLMIPTPPYSRADFAPVGIMAVTPLMLEVPAASRYKDFKSYVAAARAKPGQVTIGHSGNGTTNHIAILELEDALKVKLNLVPYKGSGPALVDLIGRHIDSMMDQTSSSLPQVKAGKLRVLAVGTPQRLADLPNVPTFQEEGLNDFEAITPSALLAPAKTPPAIVRTLNAALAKALADPAVKAKLKQLGSEIRMTTPEQLDAFMRSEEIKLKRLHEAGVLK